MIFVQINRAFNLHCCHKSIVGSIKLFSCAIYWLCEWRYSQVPIDNEFFNIKMYHNSKRLSWFGFHNLSLAQSFELFEFFAACLYIMQKKWIKMKKNNIKILRSITIYFSELLTSSSFANILRHTHHKNVGSAV